MGRVADKVAIVTGGASGIGRACALRLAEAGARVVVADRNEDGGRETAEQVGAAASFHPLDAASEASWKTLIAETVAREGRLDILVNAAGVAGDIRLQDPENVSLEEWRFIHSVNVEGVMLGCKHAIPAMRDTGSGGAIVNISSLAAMLATPPMSAYGASKAGVRQYTKSVALHCARKQYGIRCNSVHPGIIDTPMGAEAMQLGGRDPERGRERMRQMVPLGFIGAPDDIAYTVLFLASDEARFITGAEFVVDGGMSIL